MPINVNIRGFLSSRAEERDFDPNMTEPLDLEQDETADLEAIFNHYLLLSSHEDIAHDEKTKWLDLFLCRAISELSNKSDDPFIENFCNNSGKLISTVATQLVANLAIELRHVCLCLDKYKDPRPLKSYVFEGRGWKILYLLSRIQPKNQSEKTWISILASPLNLNTIQAELTTKDLVEMILNLYQLSMQNINAKKYQSEASKSASDYWENALMVSRRDDEAVQQWVKLPEIKIGRVFNLWSDLSTKYSKKLQRKRSSSSSKTRSFRKHRTQSHSNLLAERKNTLKEFPSSFHRNTVEPSNLSLFEPRSTESEAISAACMDHETLIVKAENFKNPMDFEYFEKLVRSEDEAQYQMEWLHSLQGRLGDNTPQFLNPQTCYCPDHATISTMPICGIHFCRIVVTILIQIVESEIRKRNLKTSFELSLLLNQFACEELTKLNLQETVDRMPRSPVQELRMLLVILSLTSLSEVQFYEDHSKFLQRTKVLPLSLNFLMEAMMNENVNIQNIVDLSLVLLTVVRSFHIATNRSRKKADYYVYNMFCEENGPTLIENVLKLAVESIRQKKYDGKSLGELIEEVSRYLSTVGICEIQLSYNETCSKRSVECLSSLYATLISTTRELSYFRKNHQELFQCALNSLCLVDYSPCICPVYLIERMLPLVMTSSKEVSIDFQNRSRLLRLIEASVKHSEVVIHPNASKLKMQRLDGSLSDSDSAFYASDASENKGEDPQNLQYLNPYTKQLEKDFSDSDECMRRFLKQILVHLEILARVAGAQTKINLTSTVVLPTLKTWLGRIIMTDRVSEISTMVVQKMLRILQTCLNVREIITLCNEKQIFTAVLDARKVELIRSDVFEFLFHFSSQEIGQVLGGALSVESLTVWSGTEETLEDTGNTCLKDEDQTKPVENFDSHMKTVYRIFTGNETFCQMLNVLETKSTQFLEKTSPLDDETFIETLALWRLQEKLVRFSSDYALFFSQRDLLQLLKHVALKSVQLLSNENISDRPKLDLVKLVGVSLKLLVQLNLQNVGGSSLTDVPNDQDPESTMAEIMSTLKEAILEEQKIDSPLIVRAFLDKLIKASTSANLIFDTQNVDISAFTENDTDNYDADGSESETEEDNNTKLENSECKGKIIYPGLLTYLVKIMEGLVTMNLHKFEEAIESVLSKLTALCNNETNIEILLDLNIPLSLLLKMSPIHFTLDDTLRVSTLPATHLQLVTKLCSHKMTRSEFRAFIELFKTNITLPTQRVKLILVCLDKIATSSPSLFDQPSSFITINSVSNGQKYLASVNAIGESYCRYLEFPLDFNGHDIFLNSHLSFAFWIQKRNLQSKCTIFEVACKDLKVDVSFDLGTLQVNLHNGSAMLGCAIFPFKWDKRRLWNHVVLLMSEKSNKKLQVQLIVNTVLGQSLVISLMDRIDDTKSCHDYFALCGTINDPKSEPCTVSVSSVFCFSGLEVDEALSCLLFALGPDQNDLTFTRLDLKSLHFKRLLLESPNNMRFVLNWCDDEKLVEGKILTLRQSLIFILQSENPTQLVYFKPASVDRESVRNGLSIFESIYNATSKSNSSPVSTPTQEIPHKIENFSTGANNSSFFVERPWLFWKLVSEEGGIWSLLLLLARVVELQCDDDEISIALDLCFKTMLSSPNILRESAISNPVLLMTRILRSEICKAGLHTVSIMIKHSTTEPLIFYDEKRSVFQFRYDSKAVISHQSLFESIFDCWKVWSKNPSSIDHEKSTSCLEALLKSCAILLRDDHPFREINVESFRRMRFIKKVSYVFKSDTENAETSNASVVFQIIDLFSALVGSPPDLTVVKDLMEMALLLHDTRQTFVAHSKSNFYFLMETPESETPQETKGSLPRAKFPSSHYSSNEDRLPTMKHSVSFPTLRDRHNFGRSSEEKSFSEEAFFTKDDQFLPKRNTISENETLDQQLDVNRLKNTLKELRRKRDELSSNRQTPYCLTKELTDVSRKKSVFERPEPWGLSQDEAEDQVDLGDGTSLCEGIHVIEGILNILFNVMQNLPDPSVSIVVNEIILPEYILILSNHDCANIRSRAVRLLGQYINRTQQIEFNGYRLLKIDGFILLANQLHQYIATEAVVDACLGMIHNRMISLDECPEIPLHLTTNIRVSALVPILALLPKSLHNIALAHGMILHVHELCAKVTGVLRDHKAIGLFESLIKTVLAISQTNTLESDLYDQDGREILFTDLFNLMRLISIRFITNRGIENFKSVEELFLLLMHTLWNENQKLIDWPVMEDEPVLRSYLATNSIRRCICVILEESLLQVEGKLAHHEPVPHQANPRRSSELDVYTAGIFPLEEVTDLLLRTVSPRGSVCNDEQCGHSSKRKRTWFQDSSSLSDSITSSSPSFNRNPFSESVKLPTKSELTDRFSSVITFSVDFIVDFEPELGFPMDEVFENFLFSILAFLMSELNSFLNAEKNGIKIKTIFLNSRILRSNLLLLINFCLFPEMPHRIKIRLLRMLNTHPGCSDIVACLLRHYPEQHRTLIALLRRLVQDSKSADANKLDDTDREDCNSFYSSLESWNGANFQWNGKRGEKSSSSSPSSIKSDLNDDEIIAQFTGQLRDQRLRFKRHSKTAVLKVLNQLEEMANQMTFKAVEVTKVAMKAQDEERKKFMTNIRDTLSEKVRARALWQTILEGSTHELGLWHFPQFYPQNWKLDEMEGAQRMRIRTQRSFSDIPDKFYLPDCRPITRKSSHSPFGFLLKAPSGMSGVIVAQLNSRDRIRHMDQCSLVLPSHEIFGEILLSDHSIYFVESLADDKGVEGVVSITVKLEDIREIHLRWWQLTDCAFEMFLTSGCAKFFVFADRELRNKFANQINETHPRLSESRLDLNQVTKLWLDGSLTNFDYLMHLNKLSGRTFNDLMQYPTFPFVLSDYTSNVLDLNCKRSFRNLRKPISVQDPSKEERFVHNYHVLSTELSRSHEMACPGVGPFHYGSHYSNTGVVLHYLVRVPPFTSMFIRYQDGHFDLADRSFHSLASAWELASGKSPTDVKELIPDLFYLPELLVNKEGFNLGRRQNGDRVDNVLLPPWAREDPRTFIKIHRQALESDVVRGTLNEWIDLVFGFKQTGAAAVEAVNVFHPATYYGFDLSSIEDPDLRAARATMIKTYGQTPKQLFKTPHPVAKKENAAPKAKPPKDVPTALASALGLKWGNYVGSPSQPDPVVVWSTKQGAPVYKFVSAANNEVYGVSSNAAPVLKHNLEARLTPFLPAPVLGACLVTWGHHDRHVRVKLRKNGPPEPLLALDAADDRVTVVGASPDAAFLWVGYASGKVLAVRHAFRHRELVLELHPDQPDGVVPLYGHRDRINDIAACPEFGISVTASADKSCVIWDHRTPSFVRKMDLDEPAVLVCVGRASGDVAVVSEVGDGRSTLSLYSINGDRVARRPVEPRVTALATSSAPEGSAVNVVATGHVRTGVVRLWSTWDLSPVRDLDTRLPLSPVTAVAFSFDNRALFAANQEGRVVLLENASPSANRRPAKYLNLSGV